EDPQGFRPADHLGGQHGRCGAEGGGLDQGQARADEESGAQEENDKSENESEAEGETEEEKSRGKREKEKMSHPSTKASLCRPPVKGGSERSLRAGGCLSFFLKPTPRSPSARTPLVRGAEKL